MRESYTAIRTAVAVVTAGDLLRLSLGASGRVAAG